MSFDEEEEIRNLGEYTTDGYREDGIYAPTDETVRAMYAADYYMLEVRQGCTLEGRLAAFDRWLAAHDARVLKEAADEMQDVFGSGRTLGMPSDMWLRGRASRLRAGYRVV